jgi:hypothetical protein
MNNQETLVVITWNGIETPLSCVYFDTKPNFKILLFNHKGDEFDNSSFNMNADYYLSKKTENKGQIFHYVNDYIKTNDINFYYIGIIDDDILFKVSDFNYMLFIANLYKLDIFQPSISNDSYFSHRKFVNRADVILYETEWIEIMAPFYRKELFQACENYFLKTISGQGIDLFLMPVLQKIYKMKKTAIIHAIMVKHLRPIRSHQRIYLNGLNNEQEIKIIRNDAINLTKNPLYSNLFDKNFKRNVLLEGNVLLINFNKLIIKFTNLFYNTIKFLKELSHYR